jgi:hypothetical protein
METDESDGLPIVALDSRPIRQLVRAKDVAKKLGVSISWVIQHASGKRRPYLPAVKMRPGRSPLGFDCGSRKFKQRREEPGDRLVQCPERTCSGLELRARRISGSAKMLLLSTCLLCGRLGSWSEANSRNHAIAFDSRRLFRQPGARNDDEDH